VGELVGQAAEVGLEAELTDGCHRRVRQRWLSRPEEVGDP
jgi:hypothetical protein